jgi:hypothetical protein
MSNDGSSVLWLRTQQKTYFDVVISFDDPKSPFDFSVVVFYDRWNRRNSLALLGVIEILTSQEIHFPLPIDTISVLSYPGFVCLVRENQTLSVPFRRIFARHLLFCGVPANGCLAVLMH